MKNYLKSYHVFLSNTLEQVLMYAVYPVVMITLSWLIGTTVRLILMESATPDAFLGTALIGNLVLTAEIVIDRLVFGGLLSKDTNKLEYLKTSKRGMEVLKKGVIVDKVRRILMMGACLCVAYSLCHKGGSILQIFSLTMSLAGMIELVLLLTRRSSSMFLLEVLCMAANSLSAGASILVFALPKLCSPFFAAAYVTVAVVSHRLIIGKMKRSYVDEGNYFEDKSTNN